MVVTGGIEVASNKSVDDISMETTPIGLRHQHQNQQRPQNDPARTGHGSNGKASQQRSQKKLAAGARHRLRSIYHDAQRMRDLYRRHSQSPSNNHDTNQAESLVAHALRNWKVIANERCGSWYVPHSFVSDDDSAETTTASSSDHFASAQSCYFKSTDGHVNIWEFSLKRLNLELLERTIAMGDGGCVLVDSSVRKVLPDSFSRTIPIWATVLNRIALRFRERGVGGAVSGASNGTANNTSRKWDTNLHTPKGVVSVEEHATISALIEDRVETLSRSGAIVNPTKLIEMLQKPLRVVWMNHEGEIYQSNHGIIGEDSCSPANVQSLLKDYFVIVCWNPSQYVLVDTQNSRDRQPDESLLLKVKKSYNEWINLSSNTENEDASGRDKDAPGYFYTPGAADDHESWARHLTPAIFWKNEKELMDPGLDDAGVDQLIDKLVDEAKAQEDNHTGGAEMGNSVGADVGAGDASLAVHTYSDRIGDTNLWIGSRRAGRPPECWEGFDAILNVTKQEYDDMKAKGGWNRNDELFYLQLPVEEGKRDRTQLERWMPVGLLFLIHHLQQGRRVLVHCAQGKDRSVAVALIFVILGCSLRFPLTLREEFVRAPWPLPCLFQNTANDPNHLEAKEEEEEETKPQMHMSSGIPEAIVARLLDTGGKEIFLSWIHKQLGETSRSSNCSSGSSQKLEILADKESIRIALHLIRQDRDVADPTRSTMQKINRFLMSSTIYR